MQIFNLFKMEMFAPEIDNILERFSFTSDLVDPEIYRKLKAINEVMSCIKPESDDELRIIWLEVSRGNIEVFGEFEDYLREEIIETYEQFESLWKEHYPKETKWYSFSTSKYKEELFFYFNSKLIFSIKENEENKEEQKYNGSEIYNFLDWLHFLIKKETEKLKEDSDAYNDYIEKHLSYHKRFGRIRRKDFWRISGDNVKRLDKQLGVKKVNKLRKLVLELKNHENDAVIPQMTADDFFNYCEICYNANDYFKESTIALSPKEKYLRMSDGRDAGFRSLEGNSRQAFSNWYHSGERFGAHPWEICRGGNSTHISLFVSDLDKNWRLVLAGSSVSRVMETVKMAIALNDKKVPFILQQSEEILQMVTGNDYIGIVPDFIFPRYCHSYFPEEDRIIDFMNPGFENDEIIIQNSYWYPLEKIEIDR